MRGPNDREWHVGQHAERESHFHEVHAELSDQVEVLFSRRLTRRESPVLSVDWLLAEGGYGSGILATNFASIIYEAIRQVKATHSYHILVIIADGQVTNEKETAAAIVEASKHALSIVVVGVGDGPWELMEHYDDTLPARRFDNFQFVDFNRVMKLNRIKPDVGFATAAMMEIPEQFKIIRKLGYLN